ncbi:hypothetical protein QBC44DRAFT_307360 [Cladorrhinum sp. PSN332]|nr:hypothetical protein QBC44DRAFT_307360 [Cladorrhinum sp. PSN332]
MKANGSAHAKPEGVDQEVHLIHSLLTEWDELDQNDEVHVASNDEQPSDEEASEKDDQDHHLNAQVGRIYALLSHSTDGDSAADDISTPRSLRHDLNTRAHRIHTLLAQLGDLLEQLESEGVGLEDSQCDHHDLAEENKRLRAQLHVVKNKEIPRLRKQIGTLEKTLQQKEIDLAYARSLNWELQYHCKDLGERAWRRVRKRESEGAGPKGVAADDDDFEDAFSKLFVEAAKSS